MTMTQKSSKISNRYVEQSLMSEEQQSICHGNDQHFLVAKSREQCSQTESFECQACQEKDRLIEQLSQQLNSNHDRVLEFSERAENTMPMSMETSLVYQH